MKLKLSMICFIKLWWDIKVDRETFISINCYLNEEITMPTFLGYHFINISLLPNYKNRHHNVSRKKILDSSKIWVNVPIKSEINILKIGVSDTRRMCGVWSSLEGEYNHEEGLGFVCPRIQQKQREGIVYSTVLLFTMLLLVLRHFWILC